MLSPLDVKKREFGRVLRGFDTEEVRAFLETVASEFEQLNEQNRSQLNELTKLRTEISAFTRVEQNMKDAMVNAQEALRGARLESEREAELLRREAKFEAENIIRKALNKAEDLTREMHSLKSRRDTFVRKWRHMLSSELEMLNLLEDLDNESANQGQPKDFKQERHPNEQESTDVESK